MLKKNCLVLAVLIVAVYSPVLMAQSGQPNLADVELISDPAGTCGPTGMGFQLSLTFDDEIVPDDLLKALLNPAIYEIWQVPQPSIPPFIKVNGVPTLDAGHAAPVVLTVTSTRPDKTERNIIYACTSKTLADTYDDKNGDPKLYRYIFNINPIPGGKYKKSVSKRLNQNSQNPGQPPPPPPPPSASFAPTVSKGKEDSNVYVSGEVTAGRRAKPNYTTDIRLRIPFDPNNPNTRFLFDLQTNASPKSDANSLDLGVEYASYIGLTQDDSANRSWWSKAVTHLDWSIAGKIESDRRFKNTNLVASGTFKVPIYLINRSSTAWTFDPFIGIDAGRNIKSPVANAQSRGILRPFAGITTFIGILRTGKYFPISFEAAETHRWPLIRELKLEKDDDGKLKAVFFSKGPRYFIDAKLNFQINPFVGFYIGFQRGNLPPLYEQVNPTFKAGLTYKFKFKGAED